MLFFEGTYIKDCNSFITDDMIYECYGNPELIRQSAILEGAKIDLALKNFLKEGKDYKGLKKELNQIIEANNLSKDELKSKGKGFMHTCKRILQISEDLLLIAVGGVSAFNVGAAIGVTILGIPAVGVVLLAKAIISFTISFIINRLFRFCWDSIEFNTISDDASKIITDLRKQAKKANDKKISDRLNKEADKLKEALEKYSKKAK